MSELSRDIRILQHMIDYCDQVEMAVKMFGKNFDSFDRNPVYRNSVALCILQIGELTGCLTDEFKNSHTDVPWRKIKAMRNIVAHRYGMMDNAITWEVATEDIPLLKASCLAIKSEM